MIASRLATFRGRTQATVDVKTITGTTVYSNLATSHQQIQVREEAGPLGDVSTEIHDLFLFDRVSGSLPAIEEKHVIVWSGTTYRVISAQALDELAHRLRVETVKNR